ncbi:hypothetical protein HMI54_002517 [Coelomomyces lativittatus]|nr:hypothetical protein HMI56_007572 [Coelomomyces lativittatus]KAJ1509238.1 hypothetical protein HMI54_002517 [Coelomomyces lativittatus]
MSHPPTPPMPLSSRITSGHSTHLGRRNEQQDVAWIETFPSLDKVGSPMTVYGVLDGHGSDGAQVAQWVQTQLSEFFRNLTVSSSLPPVFDKSSWSSNVDDHDDLAWEPRLLDFLESLHDRMLEPDPSSPDGRPPPPFDPYLSGTTLVLLLISRHGTVKVWNIGDSGVAVVSRSDPSSVSNEISSSNWEFLKLTRWTRNLPSCILLFFFCCLWGGKFIKWFILKLKK